MVRVRKHGKGGLALGGRAGLRSKGQEDTNWGAVKIIKTDHSKGTGILFAHHVVLA
jgi:hypothetical protein